MRVCLKERLGIKSFLELHIVCKHNVFFQELCEFNHVNSNAVQNVDILNK